MGAAYGPRVAADRRRDILPERRRRALQGGSVAGTTSAGEGLPPRRLARSIIIGMAAGAVLATAGIGGLLAGRGSSAGPAGPTFAPSLVAGAPTSPPGTVASLPPTHAPTPTPEPTPVLVPAPLTGVLVTEEAAQRKPIAVMIDDHVAARPQAGFNAASVIWHAPAEGGVPRYMLIFQDQVPGTVAPIRSARQYYVEWAAELNCVYVHHGGSPQALATLRTRGSGSWVYNADGFRWEGRYLFRADDRPAPHDIVSTGADLRKLATKLGAEDGPLAPVWKFGPDAPLAARPTGGRISVSYPYETITYRYDRATNRYVRYVDARARVAQLDAADGKPVAPANVVILRMSFGPLNDGRPDLKRLEAHNVGKGEAWIASNGVTVKGSWRKASQTAPTLLFGPDGEPVTLTAGQTVVQVLELPYDFEVADVPA